MAAIQGNLSAALGGGDPTGLLDTLRNNPEVVHAVGEYLPQHIRQNLFLPEPGTDTFAGQHPGFAHALENTLVGLGQMNQIPQTTGQSISMIANSLMAGPMAHRQWQMQQVMMPFQIAQQMGAIAKDRAEAYMNTMKGQYFSDHGDYLNRGAGAGITTQNRTYVNDTPQLASDGKEYTPGTQLPEGVRFLPNGGKGNQTGPYGGSLLGRVIAGMQGNSPEQTSGQFSDEEKAMSIGRYQDAWNKMLDSYKQQAAARNFAPGAIDPNDKFLGETASKISSQRIQEANEYKQKLNSKDYVSMVPQGVQDGEAWRQQQLQLTDQHILAEQNNLMQSTIRHDYSSYAPDMQKGFQNGQFSIPQNPMAPALGAPAIAAPTQGMTGATQPGATNLSPAASSYWSNINKQ